MLIIIGISKSVYLITFIGVLWDAGIAFTCSCVWAVALMYKATIRNPRIGTRVIRAITVHARLYMPTAHAIVAAIIIIVLIELARNVRPSADN